MIPLKLGQTHTLQNKSHIDLAYSTRSKDLGVKIIDMIDTYSKQYCDSLELAYGYGMLSEGGEEVIESMVAGLDLDGKSILDFGSGLGGAALYLAGKYNVKVTGLEINPRMIQDAIQRIPVHLKSQVVFVLAQNTEELPFKDKHFDIVMSKGVIVHLNDKQHESLFYEFNRILKPDGTLLIHDWLSNQDGK